MGTSTSGKEVLFSTNSLFAVSAKSGQFHFDDNPHRVRLSDFHFRAKETWRYEYDLTDWWQHEIRLEQVLPFDLAKRYPLCIAHDMRNEFAEMFQTMSKFAHTSKS